MITSKKQQKCRVNRKYTKIELREAIKFREEFGFDIPNIFERLFLPDNYWLAREGALITLILAGEKL